MGNAASSFVYNKGLLDLIRETLPLQERAVGLYRRLLALNEITGTMSAAGDLSDLYQPLASYCCEYAGDARAWFCIVDRSAYKRVRLTGNGSPALERTVPLHSGIAGGVISSGSPVWVPDTRGTGRGPAQLARSILALPVSAGGRTVGCLELTSRRPHRFDELEYHFGLLLTANISSSLDGLLTRQELARANARLRDHDRHLTQLNVKLQELAHTDEATGLYNKRRLFEQLEMETARAKRYGQILSCMMIDIDNFKQINDVYGHQAGDDILSQTGALLKKSLRATDFIARYGGEEFTVILPETSGAGARCAAENLRSTFMLYPFRIGKTFVHLTISIGIASCTTFDHLDARQTLMRADRALYTAKRNGKNQTVLADEADDLSDESGICQKREAALTP